MLKYNTIRQVALMYYVLYNPMSNKGLSNKEVEKLVNQLSKEDEVVMVNILEIHGSERNFIAKVKPEEKVVICGGDGTVNRFLNTLMDFEYDCRLFVFQCGSGNDLAREYDKQKMFEITDLAHRLPYAIINGQKKVVFINGIGMGFDAVVCAKKEEAYKNGVKKGYTSIVMETFKEYERYSVDLEIDGKDYHFDDVWCFVVNHGKYFGGGMKIAPKADRYDGLLDFCIVHGLSKGKFLTLFPTIFLGTHIKHEDYVTYIQCKSVKVKQIGASILQADGEVSYDVNTLEVGI
jgi:diacylglycerol kinase family enzyme